MYVYAGCVLMYLLTESRTLPTLGAKNKKVAELWGEFSTEQKETYKQKASSTNAASSDNRMTAKNLKGESKKICTYLQDLVSNHEFIKTWHSNIHTYMYSKALCSLVKSSKWNDYIK